MPSHPVSSTTMNQAESLMEPKPSALPPGELPAAIVAPLADIDAYLAAFCATLPAPDTLRDAVTYAAMGPGKRLRPLLAWWCCKAICGDGRPSLVAGASVELVHAFSLVHDDLPAMDDDDLRRGRPTLHKHTSEAMAILAGDAMLTLAFALIAERAGTLGGTALVSRLVAELAAGTTGMIAGQVYDSLGGFPGGLSDEERLRLVHTNKTGALLRAACRMGGWSALASVGMPDLAGREPAAMEALTKYADATGLMFQVVDDILDETQSTAHLGKAAKKDAEAGKLTYPQVLGLEGSRAEVRRLEAVALEALRPLGSSAEPLAVLATYMAVRTR